MRIGVDEFLLALAGVSATLLGTFIVGVFFYIDSNLHRRLSASESADLYARSGIRWVFTAYALPLLSPLRWRRSTRSGEPWPSFCSGSCCF